MMNNNPLYMRLVTYDYIFYGFEKKICYSRLNLAAKTLWRAQRGLCRFRVDQPFRENGCFKGFSFFRFRNLHQQQRRNHDFFTSSEPLRWPNLNAFFMLHILILLWRKKKRKEKK